ncbi:MAG: phosphatase PAP2 family protein [Alphaproteobacteria bacterium]|nr:phosphatase PAP2 family protein [Alphaproteobacteria bacterium]
MAFYFSACLIGAAVFLIFPQLDLAFSALFYQPEFGFVYKDLPWVQALYWAFARLQWPILAALILGLLAGIFHPFWARQRRACVFLVLALLLGPGLMVNEVLKNHWGRARPVQVTEFGGQATYSPPLAVSDQCQRNCSMSSGHAALGFYPLAMAWVRRRQRRLWLGVGLLSGGLVGLGRILQGGHFLADVLVSAAVMWGVCSLLARWLLPQPVTSPSSPG